MSSGSRKHHGVEATDLAQHGKLETVSLIGGESSVLVLVSVYNHLSSYATTAYLHQTGRIMFFAVMWDLFPLQAKLNSEVMTPFTIVVDGRRFEDEVDNTTVVVTSV